MREGKIAEELGISKDRLNALIRGGKVFVEKQPSGKPYAVYIRRVVIEKMKGCPEIKREA
jgi:hypothetical protein